MSVNNGGANAYRCCPRMAPAGPLDQWPEQITIQNWRMVFLSHRGREKACAGLREDMADAGPLQTPTRRLPLIKFVHLQSGSPNDTSQVKCGDPANWRRFQTAFHGIRVCPPSLLFRS
jgi:hypothetical protein